METVATLRGPRIFLLAGLSTRGIYDSLFHYLLDLTQRHISIATAGSELSFICTGTFSRQSGVRTSGKVSSGRGMLMVMAMVNTLLLFFLTS